MKIKWASVWAVVRWITHNYVLRLICDLFLSKNMKLYCCFIEYVKAFDSVWRDGFLLKLLKSGIEGERFNIMKNMY